MIQPPKRARHGILLLVVIALWVAASFGWLNLSEAPVVEESPLQPDPNRPPQ